MPLKPRRITKYMIPQRIIILAEDNIADVELTKIAFSEVPLPLEVVHVSDGQELLEYVRKEPLGNIALILLDLNMPRMGGIDVLKYFYEDQHFKKLPVVVLSSSMHERDVQTCYEYGANAYVCKPIDMEQFSTAIRNIAYFWGSINVLPTYEYESI
ncbi:MAG: response regulator [Bacteroidota bacterium]